MSSPSLDELSLATLAVGGSRPAFESLLRLSARAVYADLLLQTHDPHLAEDLTQETFLRAYRSIHTLSDPARFRPWLVAIARTTLYESHRNATRKKRTPPAQWPAASHPEPTEDPATALELREQRQRATAALAALPERYRLPLTLRFLEEADHAEICSRLSLTPGSLRGLLTRGLSILRESLSQEASP